MSKVTKAIGSGFFDPGLDSGNWRPFVDDLEDTDIWNAPMPRVETGGTLGDPDFRSRDIYDLVIDQFHVASNPRYQPRGGATFCNIFVQDVIRAMGVIVPWGNANSLSDYLAKQEDGWRDVSAKDAQTSANAGFPTLAHWHNPSGTGHVAVVRPGVVSAFGGSATANAGAVLFSKGTVAQGFGTKLLPIVAYATHD